MLYYIGSALVLLYVLLDVTWRIWKRKLKFLPSRYNVPWLGGIPFIPTDPGELYDQTLSNAIKYNYLYVEWIGATPFIMTGLVEYIKPIVTSPHHMAKSLVYDDLRRLFGDGLVTSTGKKWKLRRKALTGAFHFTTLKSYMEIYERNGRNLVNKLRKVALDGKEVEVQWVVNLATLDVICESILGTKINALERSESEYLKATETAWILEQKKIWNLLAYFEMIYKLTEDGKEYYKCRNTMDNFIVDVIDKIISSRQNLHENGKLRQGVYKKSSLSKNKVFIDVLFDLYDNGEIDMNGIKEEIAFFMFAGHETSSSNLSWTLYEIGRHPEVQENLHNEIETVTSKDLSVYDNIRSLKFMECVIKESLRLHPPAAYIDRQLEQELVINENTIPSGSVIAIDILSLHRNPMYWDEPTVFRPERFEGEAFAKRNPYCYLPFSAGPRNCIGQRFAMLEVKTFLFLILSNFNIRSTQTPDELMIGVSTVTKAMNGIYIQFYNRN